MRFEITTQKIQIITKYDTIMKQCIVYKNYHVLSIYYINNCVYLLTYNNFMFLLFFPSNKTEKTNENKIATPVINFMSSPQPKRAKKAVFVAGSGWNAFQGWWKLFEYG